MALSDKQLAGNQRRTLRAMRERLLAMASDWDGRDQFNMSELTEAAERLDTVAEDLVESAKGDAR